MCSKHDIVIISFIKMNEIALYICLAISCFMKLFCIYLELNLKIIRYTILHLSYHITYIWTFLTMIFKDWEYHARNSDNWFESSYFGASYRFIRIMFNWINELDNEYNLMRIFLLKIMEITLIVFMLKLKEKRNWIFRK